MYPIFNDGIAKNMSGQIRNIIENMEDENGGNFNFQLTADGQSVQVSGYMNIMDDAMITRGAIEFSKEQVLPPIASIIEKMTVNNIAVIASQQRGEDYQLLFIFNDIACIVTTQPGGKMDFPGYWEYEFKVILADTVEDAIALYHQHF